MKIAHFKKLLKGNNAVRINDDLIIFNDFELYSLKEDTSKNYETLEDLLADNPEAKEIIEEAEYFALRFDGGRGSNSTEMGGGFNHARDGGKSVAGETLLNAELNYGTAPGNSIKAVLGRFRDKYGESDTEYGAAVDEQGYVHKLNHGGKTSVGIHGNEGETVIHNHPSGGNFSDTDLITAATTRAKGVIATSSNPKINATYHFQKNQNFKPSAFVKAVRNAKWPKNLSYDKGADWWLKKNQRAYGYKYSSKKLIGE